MPALLLGSSTGASFGCTAETGILINSFSISTSSDKQEVKNENGEVKLVAYYNPKSAISVAGTVAGTTGVVAASVGVSLTLANIESVGGVTAGLVLVDSVAVTKKPDGFKDISVSATRYPLITTSSTGGYTPII
jgi:hypothetical protein